MTSSIAVLADMLELGNYTVDGHKEVGKYLAAKKIDLLFTFGEYAQYIANGAIEYVTVIEEIKEIKARISTPK
jgi:UDP-N-acetylmuramoyl-tripeptide--D-alanyl-D-alanine ligase